MLFVRRNVLFYRESVIYSYLNPMIFDWFFKFIEKSCNIMIIWNFKPLFLFILSFLFFPFFLSWLFRSDFSVSFKVTTLEAFVNRILSSNLPNLPYFHITLNIAWQIWQYTYSDYEFVVWWYCNKFWQFGENCLFSYFLRSYVVV
jgi:hypothetical protein